MKKIIKCILDFTLILSLLFMLYMIGWTIYNSVVAYQGYNYCPGFHCEELNYYTCWEGVYAFFKDLFFFIFFAFSICGVIPLVCLPICTFINLKILDKTNKKYHLLFPVLLTVIFVLLDIVNGFYGLLAIFAGVYGGIFILSYVVAFFYKKIFYQET